MIIGVVLQVSWLQSPAPSQGIGLLFAHSFWWLLGRRRFVMADVLNQHERHRVPAVEDLRIIADECENNEDSPSDSYHLRVADVERPTARHVDAEGTKRNLTEVIENAFAGTMIDLFRLFVSIA